MYQNSAVFKRRESVLVYGLATISRLLKIAGLFCRIQSLLQGSFAEETYNLKEPTNRDYPIPHKCMLPLLKLMWVHD